MTDAATPTTFNENMTKLKTIAAKVQAQKEPDVDELLVDVKEGLGAYESCSARSRAATEELNAMLAGKEASKE